MRTALVLAFLLAASSAHAQTVRRPFARPYLVRTYAPIVLRAPSAPATAPPAPAPAPTPGRVRCTAQENGIYAQASMEVRRDGRVVASGSCAAPLEVAAGAYAVTIKLETTLDRPTQTLSIDVPPGGDATALARFDTSVLEVRFTVNGVLVPGLAIIRRDGRDVGTLGSGVAGRLRSGTYEIVARYGATDRLFTVALAPGQRRALAAQF